MAAPRVTIAFDAATTPADSLALDELQESLDEAGVGTERTIALPRPGMKDGGLTIGLTIANLAVSAVSALISAITLWGSKRNYSVSFETGDATFGANNLSAREALDLAAKIKNKAVAADIKILVTRR